MARYITLSALYIGNRYIEAGTIIADDGSKDAVPIPSNYQPTVACDPQDADGIAKLTAAPHQQPTPSVCVLGLWGIRQIWSTIPVPAPSAAWKNLVHP